VGAAQPLRRSVADPERGEEARRERPRPSSARVVQARRAAARRRRFTRTFVVFVACLTLLAVGRVALSFAVVQKSLQTDAVVRQERSLGAKNAQLQEDLAQLASPVRIQDIGTAKLGLVENTHPMYLHADWDGRIAEVAARR